MGQWKPPSAPIIDDGWKPPSAPVIEDTTTPVTKPKKSGGILAYASNIWDRLNTPTVRFMNPDVRKASDEMGGITSKVAGVGDDFLSSFTSPLSVGLGVTGLGSSIAAGTARGAKLAKGASAINKAAGAGAMAHGTYKVAEGDTIGERLGGLVEAGLGSLSFRGAKLKPPTPKISPNGNPKADLLRKGIIDKLDDPKPRTPSIIEDDFTGDFVDDLGSPPYYDPSPKIQPVPKPPIIDELRSMPRPSWVGNVDDVLPPEMQPVSSAVDDIIPEPVNTAGPNPIASPIDAPVIDDIRPIAGSDSRVSGLAPVDDRPFQVEDLKPLPPIVDDVKNVYRNGKAPSPIMDTPDDLADTLIPTPTEKDILDSQFRSSMMKKELSGKSRAGVRMGRPEIGRSGTFFGEEQSLNQPQVLDAMDQPQGNTIPQAEPVVTDTLKNVPRIATPDDTLSPVPLIKTGPNAGSIKKLLSDETGNVPPLMQFQQEEAQKLMNFPSAVKRAFEKEPGKTPLSKGISLLGNTSRSLKSSVDLSPLRQAAPFVTRKAFWSNITPMIRMFGNDDYYTNIMRQIKSSPTYAYKVKNGLQLTDIHGMREEQFLSNLAEEIPVLGRAIKASDRAFTGYLDLVRHQVSDDMLAQASRVGRGSDEELAKKIMNYVNAGTGRGSLGSFESSARVLNATLFSPRLMASRLKFLNPSLYVTGDKFIRQQALRDMGGFFSAAVGMATLAKMTPGVDTSFDPTSSDFLKIKVGDTRIDIGGGFHQYLVLGARVIPEVAQTMGLKKEGGHITSSNTGKKIELGEKGSNVSGAETIYGFMRQKASPITSFALGLADGKDAIGRPFNVPKETMSMFVPLIIEDANGILKNDPSALPFLVPAVFGASVSSYEKPKTTLGNSGMGSGMGLR